MCFFGRFKFILKRSKEFLQLQVVFGQLIYLLKLHVPDLIQLKLETERVTLKLGH